MAATALLMAACGGTVSSVDESAAEGGNGGSPSHGGAAGAGGTVAAGSGGGGFVEPSCTGAPATFAPAQAPWALAIDATHLYWGDDLDDFSHMLMRRSLGGGDVELVYQAGERILDLALDEDSVYVASATNELVRIPKSDSSATVVAWEPGAVVSVALDASHAYYADMTSGRIRRVPKGGDGFETLAEGLQDASNLALDETHAYWIDEAHNSGAPAVKRVPKNGGTIEVLAEGDSVKLEGFGRSTQDGLAISGGKAFWVDEDDGAVYAVPKEGGSPLQLISGLKRPTALAIRDGMIYVAANGTNYEGRGVLKIPEQGGSPSWIVSDPSYVPWEVELGDSFVYWTNPYVTGPVSRACR